MSKRINKATMWEIKAKRNLVFVCQLNDCNPALFFLLDTLFYHNRNVLAFCEFTVAVTLNLHPKSFYLVDLLLSKS